MAEGVPLGELALVQAHAHRVVLLHRLVEHALHVAVRTWEMYGRCTGDVGGMYGRCMGDGGACASCSRAYRGTP